MRGGPQKVEFIYKKLHIYSYMFKLHVTFKVLSIWCNTPIKTFLLLLKTVLNSLILMPFCASAVFCFISFTSAKHLSLRTFFIQWNKKVTWGEIQWIGRVGHGDHAVIWPKTAAHSVQCGQVHSYIIYHKMGKCIERVFKKKIYWSQTQPLKTTPGGTLIQMGS